MELIRTWIQERTVLGRFLLISIPLLLIIALVIGNSQKIASESARQSVTSIKRNNSDKDVINSIKTHLQKIENHIYRYTVYNDNQSKVEIEENIRLVEERLEKLQPRWSNDPFTKTIIKKNNSPIIIIGKLKKQLRQLRRYINYYYYVVDDVSLRYPGMDLLLNNLLIHNNNFLQSVDEALIESRQSPDTRYGQEARDLFLKLRYTWSQQVSWFRLFVANRSGIFGSPKESMERNLKNREIYITQTKKYLERLSEIEKENGLDLQASISLAVMLKSFNEYERYFVKARDVYLSDGWRSDYPFLNESIQPSFNKLYSSIAAYENILEEINNTTLEQSYGSVEKIKTFLWMVASIVLFVMIVAYFIFEHLIRKPIAQVAHALNAEASGVSFSPLLKTTTSETRMLISAFHNMQQQVHSRQTRLTSILENAAEGIITTDEYGVIETFNTAAEKLFGYDDAEVIGKNISLLVPYTLRESHDEHIEKFKNADESRELYFDRELLAQNKSGKTFPISIKISDHIISGKRYFTAIVDDISERQAMIENLRQLAEHDALTGLYNRFYFMGELERVVKRRHRKTEKDDALLYIELDNFKYVNDTLGHLAGDYLLVEVTELLMQRTRKSDLLARIGGDEFAVLLYEVNEEVAFKVANEYRLRLQDYVFRYSGKVVDVGCSIGVAMLEDKVQTKEEMLSRADFSCHIAKSEGRNKVHLYTEKDQNEINVLSDDIGWTRRIKSSLEENRFVMARQRISKIDEPEAELYELLLRMVDDNGNLIMPSGFLKPAERFGIMLDIDKWVIHYSIRMLANEHKNNKNVRYSINLSAPSFESDDIINLITHYVDLYNVNPSSLIFEITETVAMADMGLAIRFLNRLHELGCETALDDFGVGYSSFAYLKDLPVDYVKIDGSFVQGIETNPLTKTILKSMCEVAQAMGKKTIAEFVENSECLRILDLMGVDYIQGFYIDRPQIPEHEINRLNINPQPNLKIVS